MQPCKAELQQLLHPATKMKSLLFAAFALSLIIMISAQYDVNELFTCTQNYINSVSKLIIRLAAVRVCMCAVVVAISLLYTVNVMMFCS
jgi:hypothetical protein